MRKLKLQMQLSLDGFAAGPGGQVDWMKIKWDDELIDYVREFTDPVDLILLGGKLAEGFIPYWAGVASNPCDPGYEGGVKFTGTAKIVFSNTLSEIAGNNVSIQKECNKSTINALKNSAGGDIVVYGGGGFVASLIQQGLIDEYHLFVNPIALGEGMRIFNGLSQSLNLELVTSQAFPCGIVVLVYRPA